MPHGFTDNKEISDFNSAIVAAIRPIYSLISSLQNALGDYWKRIYPVGSIYITTSDSNPSTLFGGTWEIYGAGKVLVGINTGDSDFNTVGKTGGSKSQNVRIDYQHKHEINVVDSPTSMSTHIYKNYQFNPSSSTRHYVMGVDIPASADDVEPGKLQDIPTSAVGNMWETATNGASTSNTQPVNIVQPYITVRMWRRIA